jgi:hypothetical protein
MSDQQTMLWGEPHDHAVPVCRLAQMIAPIDDRWPRANYFAPPDSDAPLSEQWIANLSPKIISLQSAHRQFLRSWLREPAEQAGRSRWGLKEVRLTADHARYLQWLFPQAKFVFLYRDVLNSFLSCRDVKWFSVWPHYRVSRVSSFAHHWVHLVTGFLDAQSEINAHVISYEDLVEGRASLGALAAYLDSAAFDKSVLQVRVGARGARQERLSFREAATLDAIAGPLRARLGYS